MFYRNLTNFERLYEDELEELIAEEEIEILYLRRRQIRGIRVGHLTKSQIAHQPHRKKFKGHETPLDYFLTTISSTTTREVRMSDHIQQILQDSLSEFNARFSFLERVIEESKTEQLQVLSQVERVEAALKAYMGEEVAETQKQDAASEIRAAAEAAIARLSEEETTTADKINEPMVGKITVPSQPKLYQKRENLTPEQADFRDFLKEKALEIASQEPYKGTVTQREIAETLNDPKLADGKTKHYQYLKDALTELVLEECFTVEKDAVWGHPGRAIPNGVKLPGRKVQLYTLTNKAAERESETKEGDLQKTS